MNTSISESVSRPAMRRRAIVLVALLGLAATIFVGYKVIFEKATGTAANDRDPPATPNGAKTATKDGEPEIVKLSPEVAHKYGIRLGVAKKRKLVCDIVAPARVSFNNEATAVVGSPIQGRVIDIQARAGDTVKKGAVLLVLESAELGEAESDFLQKHTAAATAKLAIMPLANIYARVKQLYDESHDVVLVEVQKREFELRQAEGALANAEAARIAAENKLLLLGMDDEAIDRLLTSGKMNPLFAVKSPLAGQVIERNVNLGELVKPEREKLFVVADTHMLWVWADVPESRAREVVEGAAAQVTSVAVADRSFPGVVSHIAASIDPHTRSLQVRIEVPTDPALKPGMFAHVKIKGKSDGENAEAVLAVPEAAIQTVNGSTAVFIPVVDEANTFRVRMVSIGICVDGTICIISGLEEGERIVTGGSAILKADLLKASAKDED